MGIDITPGSYSNEDFAVLLVQYYNDGYDIEVPNRELLLQNLTELANTETLPDTLYSTMDTSSSDIASSLPASSFTDGITSYTDQIVEQLSLMPCGYQVTVMLPQGSQVGSQTASDAVYQKQNGDIWNSIQSYEFNTPMDIAQYDEYDNDTE